MKSGVENLEWGVFIDRKKVMPLSLLLSLFLIIGQFRLEKVEETVNDLEEDRDRNQ